MAYHMSAISYDRFNRLRLLTPLKHATQVRIRFCGRRISLVSPVPEEYIHSERSQIPDLHVV